MRIPVFAFALSVLALMATGCGTVSAPSEPPQDQPIPGTSARPATSEQDRDPRFEGTYPAPPFPDDAVWLNAATAPSWEDLAGRIVVLDFWTYGCINCLHMIPILQDLDREFGDRIEIVGIHSGKFQTEIRSDAIAATIDRLEIHHPVMNDAGFRTWSRYRVEAWPTLVFVDPHGRVIGRQAGEIPRDVLRAYVGELVAYWDDRRPESRAAEPPRAVRRPREEDSPGRATAPPPLGALNSPVSRFRYPQGLAVGPDGRKLYVADTGNDRIVVIDLAARDISTIIGGTPGFVDGPAGAAQFRRPRGLAVTGETLYVADSGNTAIRMIDLGTGSVSTLTGSGTRGRGAPPVGTRFPAGTDYELSTPFDVAVDPAGRLHVALTGIHQIWTWDLESREFGPSVGTGHEGAVSDVPAAEAELAQPSGLAVADGRLYIADAESSTVRALTLADGMLGHLAGTTRDTLFDFGNADGPRGINRLQHPLGIAASPTAVYIADTYNHAIRRVNPTTGAVTTVAGGTGAGYEDGRADAAVLDHPGAVALAGPHLYIADTNNHVIRRLTLETGAVATVILPGDEVARGARVGLPVQSVRPTTETLRLEVRFPPGMGLTPAIPSDYRLTIAGAPELPVRRGTVSNPVVEIPVNPDAHGAGSPEGTRGAATTYRLDTTIYYCETDNPSLCYVDRRGIDIPVRVAGNEAPDTVVVRQRITDAAE